jgi:hypothetical protein
MSALAAKPLQSKPDETVKNIINVRQGVVAETQPNSC